MLFATAAAAAVPRFAFELLAPHVVKRSTASLDKPLEKAIATALDKTTITTVEEAMDFSLSVTDKLLHFGLDHPTSMSFTAADREGNCIEYANLFARVFDKAAHKGGLTARAFAVHSDKAHLFGRAVPLKGFGDHDWALIQDGQGDEAQRWFVDPTMHDAGLGWDVSANVKGAVHAPVKAKHEPHTKGHAVPRAAKKTPKKH